jgi:hypothetical protein
MTTTTNAREVLDLIRLRNEAPPPRASEAARLTPATYAHLNLPKVIAMAIHERFNCQGVTVAVWPVVDAIMVSRRNGGRCYAIPHAPDWGSMMNAVEETVLEMLDDNVRTDTETQEWDAFLNRIRAAE